MFPPVLGACTTVDKDSSVVTTNFAPTRTESWPPGGWGKAVYVSTVSFGHLGGALPGFNDKWLCVADFTFMFLLQASSAAVCPLRPGNAPASASTLLFHVVLHPVALSVEFAQY